MTTPVSTVEPVVSVGTMRRLYALPADLVERIQLFQRNNGIAWRRKPQSDFWKRPFRFMTQ